MSFFSRDAKKNWEYKPGGLVGYTSALEPKVSDSFLGWDIFFKSWPIYKFNLISSVYGRIIPKLRNTGSSGRYVYVRFAILDSEGASVVRSQVVVVVARLKSILLKILGCYEGLVGPGFETFTCRYFYSQLRGGGLGVLGG